MPKAATWDDVDQAKPGPSKSVTWDDVTPKVSAAELKAKSAQPTQFEQERANESNTPWTDIGKGLGEGVLKTVSYASQGLHAIPGIGETLAPEAGIKAEKTLATPRTPGEKLGAAEEGVVESIPTLEGAGELAKPFVGPVSRFAAENILPSLERGIPYAGRVLKFAEEAPSAVKAAARGATTGAAYGSTEPLWHGRFDPGEMARGALYGGALGAGLGAGAYKLGQINPTDIENVPFAGEKEPPPTRIPTVSREPFALTPPEAGRETAIQQKFEMPSADTPTFRGSAIDRLGEQIEQGAGWKPLDPNVPLGAQPRSVGAAALSPEQVNPRIPVIGHPLGSRVATDVSEALGPTAKAEGKIPTIMTEEPARQAGGGPLRPDVSLREQPKFSEAPVRSEQARLEEKYPDKGQRQMVHANGEKMVDAIGEDPDTMRDVHNLTNSDVRQAMINSGEDMGQKMINNRKASGDISRQKAFETMLAKGLSPRQIVELAKRR